MTRGESEEDSLDSNMNDSTAESEETNNYENNSHKTYKS